VRMELDVEARYSGSLPRPITTLPTKPLQSVLHINSYNALLLPYFFLHTNSICAHLVRLIDHLAPTKFHFGQEKRSLGVKHLIYLTLRAIFSYFIKDKLEF
jgi:hypothetical protein